MKSARIATWAAALLSVAVVAAALRPQRPVGGFDLEAFGRLPVLEGGRVKPIDSVARNALLMIRSQQSFSTSAEGGREKISASRWLLDVLFRPEVADAQPAFVLNDPDLLGLLGLEQGKSRYHAFQEFVGRLDEVQKQAQAAQEIEAARRSPFQRAVLNLAERAWLYARLGNTMQLRGLDLEVQLGSVGTEGALQVHRELDQLAQFRPLPPAAGQGPEAWRSVGQGLAGVAAGQRDPILEAWARLGKAWRTQDAPSFDAAVTDLLRLDGAAAPGPSRHAAREIVFNRAQPFTLGIALYVLALLAVFGSWLWKPQVLGPVSFTFLVSGTVVHTAGLVARVVLQGRPPVTNLYSSAIFVGWVAVALGLVLEQAYRRGFGTVVAGAIGVTTLIVAQNLTGTGDTMEMMRAVLDSNFWLATHVITITIGYGATFLAGFLAVAWAIQRQVAPAHDPGDRRALVSMTYGVICFGLFFSFLGTVLGGIWADQSWGRFWGWDPKENGALLIVLWNAIILHARWGGHARDRGIMTMAIFGNVITALSWFGVNMLGVGLHSYGFMDKAFWALFGFIATQLALMALALAPPRFWSRATTSAAGGPGPASGP